MEGGRGGKEGLEGSFALGKTAKLITPGLGVVAEGGGGERANGEIIDLIWRHREGTEAFIRDRSPILNENWNAVGSPVEIHQEVLTSIKLPIIPLPLSDSSPNIGLYRGICVCM